MPRPSRSQYFLLGLGAANSVAYAKPFYTEKVLRPKGVRQKGILELIVFSEMHDLHHHGVRASIRPVHVPRLHRTRSPKSNCLGRSDSFMGNPPLVSKTPLESDPAKSRFLVRGLTDRLPEPDRLLTAFRRSQDKRGHRKWRIFPQSVSLQNVAKRGVCGNT